MLFGAVTDPKSIFGQSFVELQFYPDAIVSSCSQSGGFQVKFAPNTYSVCSPVWRLTSTGQKGVFHENAAFNAMLTDGTGPNNPLIMHAGDTITVVNQCTVMVSPACMIRGLFGPVPSVSMALKAAFS